MKNNAPKVDWFIFWIHYLFGSLLGGLLGALAWVYPVLQMPETMLAAACCIAGGSLLLGLPWAGLGLLIYLQSQRQPRKSP